MSELRSATVGTAGAKLIRIVSEHGVLKIDGRVGDSAANVRGRAMGSSRRVLSKIALTTSRAGDVKDGSGSININGVDGDVKVTDGSGSIAVANVTGDVAIPDDGSGTLSAQRIGGSVRVGDKGSGDLSVAHVGADLVVGEKGHGAVRYDDIRGKVTVPQRRSQH